MVNFPCDADPLSVPETAPPRLAPPLTLHKVKRHEATVTLFAVASRVTDTHPPSPAEFAMLLKFVPSRVNSATPLTERSDPADKVTEQKEEDWTDMELPETYAKEKLCGDAGESTVNEQRLMVSVDLSQAKSVVWEVPSVAPAVTLRLSSVVVELVVTIPAFDPPSTPTASTQPTPSP
jgi:hypothetical protein